MGSETSHLKELTPLTHAEMPGGCDPTIDPTGQVGSMGQRTSLDEHCPQDQLLDHILWDNGTLWPCNIYSLKMSILLWMSISLVLCE